MRHLKLFNNFILIFESEENSMKGRYFYPKMDKMI